MAPEDVFGTVFSQRNHESLLGCEIDLSVSCNKKFLKERQQIKKTKIKQERKKIRVWQTWEDCVIS